MSGPLFMLNRTASAHEYSACLVDQGRLRMTALPRRILAKASEWSSEWDKQAKIIKLDCLDRLEGYENENAELKLIYRDERGKQRTIALACANSDERDRVIAALCANLGETWAEIKTFESRGTTVGKGLLILLGALFLAWLINALANDDLPYKHVWLTYALHEHGIKGALAPALMWFTHDIGQPAGGWIADVIAGIGALLFISSFFWPLAQRFQYARPSTASTDGFEGSHSQTSGSGR